MHKCKPIRLSAIFHTIYNASNIIIKLIYFNIKNNNNISFIMSQAEIDAYIAQLSEMEKKVLTIASTHLETSFNIVKSIGFQEWKKKQLLTNSLHAKPLIGKL